MSFPRYERYKESGVEWLDEVPEHWVISRLGFEAWVRARLGWRGLKADEYVEDGYVFLSTPNLKLKQIDFDDVNYIDKQRYEESPEIQLRTGDVLLAKDGSTLGTVNVVRSLPRPATVNSSIAVITPRESLDGIYLYYLFQSGFMEHTIQRIKGGMGVPHLFQEDLNKFYLPLPRTAEQTRIASFLDAETGKIDALIEEQRRLIELLKEKRQAVISHAVTKGLNPDAPMKDSGLDWLGRMPAHWLLCKFSRLFLASKGRNGQQLTKEYCAEHDGPYPVFSGQTSDDGVMASIDEFEFDFMEPGVLFSTTVGAKAMDLKRVAGKFSLSQNCMIIWPRTNSLSVRFYYYHCQPLFRHEREMIPDHMQASFRMEDLYGYRVAVPPYEEQEDIATYLDVETKKFADLIHQAEIQILLLQERRSALISAAVTGKIDVRNYAPSKSAVLEEAYEPA